MKKNLIAVLFAAFSLSAFAQKAIVFKLRLQPDHIYHSITDMNMDMTMNVTNLSRQDSIEMKQQGAQFPMTMVMDNHIKSSWQTGSENQEKRFPAVIKYDEMTVKMRVNGKETDIPTPLTNQKIYGSTDENNHLRLDSVSGKALDESTKATLMNMLEQMFSKIEFPENPLKPGDTFNQNVPLNLPVAGANMKCDVVVTYKLNKIQGDLAFFDVVQGGDFKFDMQQGATMDGKATGTGTMVFNVKAQYPVDFKSDMILNYSMPIPQKTSVMKASAKMVLLQQTQVSSL